MKHKTMFRLLIKAVGVYCAIQGCSMCLSQLGWILASVVGLGGAATSVTFLQLVALAGWITQIGIGLYLFFGGKWVVDMAIPGNRPYCHECGYDLTGAPTKRCPECDTPFDPNTVRPPSSATTEIAPPAE